MKNTKLSSAPGVGTRANVQSQFGGWGFPGVGHAIDKCHCSK